jgi:hypothetical protein
MRRTGGSMSFDLGVWYPHDRLTDKEAGLLYACLCEDEACQIEPHASVDAFYAELTAKHPEIDTIPDDLVDDHDLCPWSCALDRSPGHVIMPSVWSKAEYVSVFVHSLARKHGLAVYDPQADRITYPDGNTSPTETRRPWWRFW